MTQMHVSLTESVQDMKSHTACVGDVPFLLTRYRNVKLFNDGVLGT